MYRLVSEEAQHMQLLEFIIYQKVTLKLQQELNISSLRVSEINALFALCRKDTEDCNNNFFAYFFSLLCLWVEWKDATQK